MTKLHSSKSPTENLVNNDAKWTLVNGDEGSTTSVNGPRWRLWECGTFMLLLATDGNLFKV